MKSTSLEVLFTPAEYEALSARDLTKAACVVFDIFRATSTIVTALANGASAIIPVAEISDALELRRERPELLLAGEREGLRIHKGLTGGVDFDLGNSPREFTPDHVGGKSIVLTTTNGSRALRACSQAGEVLVGSFLNLAASVAHVQRNHPAHLLLVCSGTGNQAAYEDILGAGAFIDLLGTGVAEEDLADSARAAREIFQQNRGNLLKAAGNSRNGRRLMSIPELRDDVPWCLERDRFPLVAKLEGKAIVRLP